MTARRAVTRLALLAGATLLVAACGNAAATTAPTTAPITQAPPTQAPTQAPASTDGALPSLNLESFHGNVDLEALLPDTIGGEALTSLSMTGDQFLTTGNANELQTALSALGKKPSDLSVAFGGNSKITIIAFQVNGVSGSSILDAFRTAYQANSSATVTDVSFGGKSVKKLTPTDATQSTSYIYTSSDVVFTIGGDKVTDALLNEAFSKLP